ncbi:unnamed protein product [Amoebophrya sp. A25]|nr:unnamed protein product [Amoebophrya sp. A25]|eukprot:GSA25T00002317001.1
MVPTRSLTTKSKFRILSHSPLMLVCDDFLSEEECKLLVEAGEDLAMATVEDADLRATLQISGGLAHGFGPFRRLYRLPGSRKLRAEFDLSPGTAPEVHSLLHRLEGSLARLTGCESHEDEYRCVLNVTPGRPGVRVSAAASEISPQTADAETNADTGNGAAGDTNEHIVDAERGDGAVAQRHVSSSLLENGLHIDTFNDAPRRFATAILYLNDLRQEQQQGGDVLHTKTDDECWGHTVFPLALRTEENSRSSDENSTCSGSHDEPVEDQKDVGVGNYDRSAGVEDEEIVHAGRRLLEHHGLMTTDPAVLDEYDPEEDSLCGRDLRRSSWNNCVEKLEEQAHRVLTREAAARLDALKFRGNATENDVRVETRTSRISTSLGVAVRPKAGRLLVFFTRDEAGDVDFRSWHGSAIVCPEANEKWTLQTFKAVQQCHGSSKNRSTTGSDNTGGSEAEGDSSCVFSEEMLLDHEKYCKDSASNFWRNCAERVINEPPEVEVAQKKCPQLLHLF